MAAGEGCRAGALVWDWGSHEALSFASQKAPKYSLNLETACGASTILGQAVKVWAAAQGCVDAGRAVRGLLWCHCEHTDTLLFQSEGCGGAQQPQAEHPPSLQQEP